MQARLSGNQTLTLNQGKVSELKQMKTDSQRGIFRSPERKFPRALSGVLTSTPQFIGLSPEAIQLGVAVQTRHPSTREVEDGESEVVLS